MIFHSETMLNLTITYSLYQETPSPEIFTPEGASKFHKCAVLMQAISKSSKCHNETLNMHQFLFNCVISSHSAIVSDFIFRNVGSHNQKIYFMLMHQSQFKKEHSKVDNHICQRLLPAIEPLLICL